MRGGWLYLWALCLSGCEPALGPAQPWVAAEEIRGALRVELSQPPVPREPREPLRVVSYNVHFGEDVAGLARALAGDEALARADVLLLQEIESYPSEGRSRAARLAEALALGYAYVPARVEPGAGEEGTHGLAVLSALPIGQLQVMELPRAEVPVSPRRRIATSCVVGSGAAQVRVVNVHLDTRLNLAERVLQLRPAVPEAVGRVIVAGDLNSNPYVWAGGGLPVLPATAGGREDQLAGIERMMVALGYAAPTHGVGATQRAVVVDLALDAIFAAGFVPGAAGVVRAVDQSDHWPVYADLGARPR